MCVSLCSNTLQQKHNTDSGHSLVQREPKLRLRRQVREDMRGRGSKNTDIVVLVQQKNLIVSCSGWHIGIWLVEFNYQC